MATNPPVSVPKITVTASRIDAVVVFGATRYAVVVDPTDPAVVGLEDTINTLRDLLVAQTKADLQGRLDLDFGRASSR